MAIGAIIAAAAAATESALSGRRARADKKRAARVQRRRRQFELRRAQIQNIEEFRAQAGSILNLRAQQAGTQGSALQGDLTSLLSQVATNTSFNQQLEEFTRRQERFLRRAQTHENIAAFHSANSRAFASFGASSGRGS